MASRCTPPPVTACLTALGAVALATVLIFPPSSKSFPKPAREAIGSFWATSPGRPPPALAPSWKAKVIMLGGTYIYSNTSGMFYSDAPQQRFRLKVQSHTSVYEPSEAQDIDMLIKNVPGFYANFTYGVNDASICHPFALPQRDYTSGGGDPFWWVPLAQFNATVTVGQETCDSYIFVLGEYVASICIAADGTPRYMTHTVITSTLAYVTSVFGGLLVFYDAEVGPAADSDFAPTQQCSTILDHPLCPGTGTVTLDVYRMQHSNEPYELWNRNVGDALGDMFFTCASSVGSTGEGKRVAHYSVTVNSTFGPFQQCQYDSAGKNNYCVGFPNRQVGRSTPENLGGQKWAGQCTSNKETGSWFSFPAEGQCKDGEAVGTNGCTWSAKFERAVDLGCILIDRQLLESCGKEVGHPPFSKSAAIFEAALASDDPSKGGCPTSEQVLQV